MASPFPADPKATPRRKPVEEQLRESEFRAHAFLDNSPNLIFIKDKELRYLYVNREFERALRVDRERIRGKKDHDVFPHEQASAFHANDLEVLTAGVPIEFEEVSQQEDGPHTSIVHKFPLFDAAREIYAIGGIVTDITERKRSREAVRHSEERFLSVLETATDAVASVDQSPNHFCESGDN
jgi:PAS domain S-box-containing protein